MIICKICGYETKNSLQAHLNHVHNLKNYEYKGPIYSEEYSERHRQTVLNRDPFYKQKLSESTKKLYQDPAWTKKHNETLKKAQNTEEARKNHREGHYRQLASRTPEQVEKHKETMRKSWADPEKRKNRVEALKNAHKSKEGRKNHSESVKKYYKNLTEEQRQKVRDNLKQAWAKPELREKILELSKAGLKKAMSPEGQANRDLANLRPEVREKRRLACKNRVYDHEKLSLAAIARLKKQPVISSLNIKLRWALRKAGLRPKPEQRVGYCLVDFLFQEEKFAVEADGNFWHANPALYDRNNLYPCQKKMVIKDKQENTYCKNHSYTLLRFWETEINTDLEGCVRKIKEKLEELRSC